MSQINAKYITHMGNDLTPVNAARISFGSTKEELDEKDKKLLKYLAKHKHYSPFEHCSATFIISCPLYIRSQIMRHRTFAYNEISRRYTTKDLSFYMPKAGDYRQQSSDNKQASEGSLDEAELALNALFQKTHGDCLAAFNVAINNGLCREQARGLLPQNLMTEFYMSGNLRNWAHFLKLRLGKDSQKEVQYIAQDIEKELADKFSESFNVLMEY